MRCRTTGRIGGSVGNRTLAGAYARMLQEIPVPSDDPTPLLHAREMSTSGQLSFRQTSVATSHKTACEVLVLYPRVAPWLLIYLDIQ
jgi:hypothetical protein